MSVRADLLSTMKPLPTFRETEQVTDKNVIRHNEDGTITVIPRDEIGDYGDVNHDADSPEGWNDNLAEELTPGERMQIADELIEYYETDEEVRQEHFQRLKDGLQLLGVTDMPEADVPFPGAATVQHPLIAEAVTQFQARAIEEFFPPTGPVKAYIMGEATDEKVQQGERLSDYMNYQLTEADDEYYWSTDQMLFYLPLSGSAFKKCYIDPITGMTTSRFVSAEDFIVPYYARTLKNAPRYCHRYEMAENDVQRAQEAGSFIEDARLMPTPQIGSQRGTFTGTSIEDQADDRTPNKHEDDNVYTLLEYHIDYRMPWDDDDDIAPPYIITVESESREVLAIRRNWKWDDPLMQKRVWFVHYKYLPGLGFYGFGLLHIIGSLAKAASGGIRALLDSAAVANLQGGFKSKEAKIAGEVRFTPGKWQDVDMSAEELEKAFFNLPVKEPSTALANLVETLVQEGRRFATTTENMVGDASNQGPVGTTLALIEQGSKVFSGIHKRMHVAARQEFKMIATLNFEFMDQDEYPYEVQGESRTILKRDFDGRVDVIPVSDPNIWSSTQRIAQCQATMELVTVDPGLYPKKVRKIIHRRMLEALRVPDVDQIMPEDRESPLDPVSENMGFLVGAEATAYPNQDHQAHIAVHMNFAQTQAAQNPDLVKDLEPIVQAHIREHQAYQYRQEIEQQLGIQLPYYDLSKPDEMEDLPEELEHLISQAVAKKLKPPPPPAPTPEEQQAQQEQQREEDERDAEVIAKIQRGLLEAGAEIKRKDEASDAEQKRKDKESQAEQRRKDKESRAEVRRQNRLARAKATFGGPVSAPRSSASKKTRRKKTS